MSVKTRDSLAESCTSIISPTLKKRLTADHRPCRFITEEATGFVVLIFHYHEYFVGGEVGQMDEGSKMWGNPWVKF